jgi:hypothetical protein
MTHGLRSSYNHGCRCAPCADANSLYDAQRRHGRSGKSLSPEEMSEQAIGRERQKRSEERMIAMELRASAGRGERTATQESPFQPVRSTFAGLGGPMRRGTRESIPAWDCKNTVERSY